MVGTPVEIAVASMDIFPVSLPGAPSWSSNLEGYVPFLEATGVHNLEVYPTTAITQDIGRRTATGDMELVRRVVGSQHMTFNSGAGLSGKIADACGVLRNVHSVDGMALVQSALPAQVPAVMFREHAPKGGFTDNNTGLKLRVVQPAAEVYRDLGNKYPDLDVRTNDGLLEALRREGIVGLCPDDIHSRRSAEDGTRTPDVETVWGDQFASGKVYQFHAASDRRDMARCDPQLAQLSAEEFAAFTSRDWRAALRTQMGQMIVEGVQRWIPPADLGHAVLRAVVEIPPLPKAMLQRVKQHARFVANLAEVIRHAGGRPLLWGDTFTLPHSNPQ